VGVLPFACGWNGAASFHEKTVRNDFHTGAVTEHATAIDRMGKSFIIVFVTRLNCHRQG
jgi:hypothetical protein